jgi:hypothetical protein
MMKDPIRFVFSNNSKCGSKLISYVTAEPNQQIIEVPSHFSIVLWQWVVIESTMLRGVEPKLFAKFKDHNHIIAEFAPKDSGREAADLAKKIAESNRNAAYDIHAALYLGVHELLNRWFGTPIPAKNRFDNAKEFFCNELFREWYGGDVSMKHPNALLHEMKNDEDFIRLA